MKRIVAWLGLSLALPCCLSTTTDNGSVQVGPEGGQLVDPRGLTLTLPPGAVSASVTLIATVVETPKGLPGSPVTPCWHIQPDGLRLLKPGTIALSPGRSLESIVTAPDQNGAFELLATTVAGDRATAPLEHFSIFVGVVDSGFEDDGGSDAGVADSGSVDGGEPIDAGATDAGDADAAVDSGVDAGPVTCGTPIWDGGVSLTCASPSADAGRCSDWNPYNSGWGFGATRTCENGGQSLDCSNGQCWCDSFDRQVAFPMVVNDTVCVDLIEQVWECACGFSPPPGAPIDCSISLNGWDGGLFSLSEGSICTDGTQCEYGVCLNTSYGQICSKVCAGDESECGCGFRCVSAYPDPHAAFCMP